MSSNNLSLAVVLKMVNEAAAPMRSAVQDFMDLGAAAIGVDQIFKTIGATSSATAGAIGNTAPALENVASAAEAAAAPIGAIEAAATSATAAITGVTDAAGSLPSALDAINASAASATDAVGSVAEASGSFPSALTDIEEAAKAAGFTVAGYELHLKRLAKEQAEAASAANNLNETTDATANAAESAADETRRYDSALDRVRHGVGDFMRQRLPGYWQNVKMATVAAATAVVAGVTAIYGAVAAGTMWVKSKAEEAGAMVKAASAVGLATDSYQRLEYAFKSVGLTGDDLDGTMNGLANKATQAAAGSKEQARAFNALGIRLTEGGRKMKKTDVLLGEIADRFAKLPDGTKKATLAMMLFGEKGADLIPLLNQGSDGLKKLGDEATKLGIVLNGQTLQKSAELTDAWDKMQTTINGLKNAIWTGLLPSVVDLVTWVSNLLEVNREEILKGITSGIEVLVADMPKVLKGLNEFWNFLAAIVSIGGSVVDVVGGLSNALDILAVVMIGNLALGLRSAIGSVVALNAAFWLCPVTWIVAGITAVAVGAYLLFRHWDKVSGFFSGVWKQVTSVFDSALTWISDHFAKLPLPLKLMWAPLMIIKHWDKVTAFFKNAVGWISDHFAKLPLPLKLLAAPVMIVKHWDTIKSFFGDLWVKVSSAWQGLPPWAQALINLPMAIVTNWDKIVPVIINVWESIQSAWQGAADWFGGIFSAINATIKSHVDALWESFPDWFKDLLRGAGKVWQFIFGGEDPTAGLPANSTPPAFPSALPNDPPTPRGAPVALTSQDHRAGVGRAPDINGSVALRIESDQPVRVAEISTGRNLDMDITMGNLGPRRS